MRPRLWLLGLRVGLGLSWIALPNSATCQSRLDFAEHLLRQGDYFRSISVLKELSFYANDPQQQIYLRLKLGEAYRKSNRTTAAIYYYTQALADPISTDEFDARANIGVAMSYIQAETLPMARMVLNDSKEQPLGRSRSLVSALIAASEGDYALAAKTLSALAPEDNDHIDINLWTQRFETADLPKKSPSLAGALSFMIPGAGQVYSGHYFDALLSFALVSSFALASYAAYRYEKEIGGSYVTFAAGAAITAMFHAANVLGATRTAEYYNYKVREDFISGFRIEVLSLEF